MLEIYTDGSCTSNPGGSIGYSALYIENGKIVNTISKGEYSGTSNQAELLAAILALESIPNKALTMSIYSDSLYVVKGMTEWRPSRHKKISEGKLVPNQELWDRLEEVASIHNINWLWVKGHSTNQYNKLVDKLAKQEAQKYKGGR